MELSLPSLLGINRIRLSFFPVALIPPRTSNDFPGSNLISVLDSMLNITFSVTQIGRASCRERV